MPQRETIIRTYNMPLLYLHGLKNLLNTSQRRLKDVLTRTV